MRNSTLPVMKSINPSSLQLVKEYPQHSELEIEERLAEVGVAQKKWRATNFTQRKVCMYKLASELEHIKQHAVETMAYEMGKPWAEGLREISKCALLCDGSPIQREAIYQQITYPRNTSVLMSN